jgi:hypothetical protein
VIRASSALRRLIPTDWYRLDNCHADGDVMAAHYRIVTEPDGSRRLVTFGAQEAGLDATVHLLEFDEGGNKACSFLHASCALPSCHRSHQCIALPPPRIVPHVTLKNSSRKSSRAVPLHLQAAIITRCMTLSLPLTS